MIEVNALGDACPIPVIKTKKVLSELNGPETVKVLVDNEVAVSNVTKLAQSAGGTVRSEKEEEKRYAVIIEMQGAYGKEAAAEAAGGDLIVVVSSDRMGEGNDELGKVLIKGFIFAVTQLDELPKKMLFYNGGATLTCEGADTLADLKALSGQGVEIMTCGTCLDYYQMKEKLAVGTITNMYSIVESMASAGRILRP